MGINFFRDNLHKFVVIYLILCYQKIKNNKWKLNEYRVWLYVTRFVLLVIENREQTSLWKIDQLLYCKMTKICLQHSSCIQPTKWSEMAMAESKRRGILTLYQNNTLASDIESEAFNVNKYGEYQQPFENKQIKESA